MNAWLRAIAFAIVILPSMARADTTPPALVPVRVAITPVYYGAIVRSARTALLGRRDDLRLRPAVAVA